MYEQGKETRKHTDDYWKGTCFFFPRPWGQSLHPWEKGLGERSRVDRVGRLDNVSKIHTTEAVNPSQRRVSRVFLEVMWSVPGWNSFFVMSNLLIYSPIHRSFLYQVYSASSPTILLKFTAWRRQSTSNCSGSTTKCIEFSECPLKCW